MSILPGPNFLHQPQRLLTHHPVVVRLWANLIFHQQSRYVAIKNVPMEVMRLPATSSPLLINAPLAAFPLVFLSRALVVIPIQADLLRVQAQHPVHQLISSKAQLHQIAVGQGVVYHFLALRLLLAITQATLTLVARFPSHDAPDPQLEVLTLLLIKALGTDIQRA